MRRFFALLVQPKGPDPKSVMRFCVLDTEMIPACAGELISVPLKDGSVLTARYISTGQPDGAEETPILHVAVECVETCALLCLSFGFVCYGTEGLDHDWGRLNNDLMWIEVTKPTNTDKADDHGTK